MSVKILFVWVGQPHFCFPRLALERVLDSMSILYSWPERRWKPFTGMTKYKAWVQGLHKTILYNVGEAHRLRPFAADGGYAIFCDTGASTRVKHMLCKRLITPGASNLKAISLLTAPFYPSHYFSTRLMPCTSWGPSECFFLLLRVQISTMCGKFEKSGQKTPCGPAHVNLEWIWTKIWSKSAEMQPKSSLTIVCSTDKNKCQTSPSASRALRQSPSSAQLVCTTLVTGISSSKNSMFMFIVINRIEWPTYNKKEFAPRRIYAYNQSKGMARFSDAHTYQQSGTYSHMQYAVVVPPPFVRFRVGSMTFLRIPDMNGT